MKILHRIWKDVKDNGAGIFTVLLYLGLLTVLVGEVCPVRIFLGFPCPGCGLTRAFWEILHLHFIKAAQMNLFAYFWIALGLYIAVNRYIVERKTPYLGVFLGVLIGAMMIYYVYRMMVYFPDTEPMTYNSHSLFGSLFHGN